ncbi:MAG TPA: hypothetical protein V6D25_12190 [Leptolyngbyaceae cyanobacterium]
MSTSSDRDDKDNTNYTFTPPVIYSPQQVETGNKVIEIINSSLSDEDKSKTVWSVLNNANT